MNKIERLKLLTNQLNQYRDEYYNKATPSVSDQEYDKLFDELLALEKDVGIYMSNSPTQTVGYEVKSKLNKVTHNHPMLSLGKTKNVLDIVDFFKNHDGVAMLKMDGLTCSLGYQNDLISAESRGNGEIGEDLLHNAKVVSNIPLRIEHDDFIVDGEMIIDYPTFERINAKMSADNKYKNPRNLCSGSIRQLDSRIAAERGIKFIAWKLIKGSDSNDFAERLNQLVAYGFDVVPFETIQSHPTVEEVQAVIDSLKHKAIEMGYPIDGIVFSYKDVAYGDSLGATSHHVNSQIAFKFENDVEYTTLNAIQWQVGRTGLITPVGLLDTINILDTDVSKVSLHNLSVMEELDIKLGATVGIIKANEIIPMCVECDGNGTDIIIPTTCPCCGTPTEIRCENTSRTLHCTNAQCKARLISKLTHFVSRDCMNIDGLSEATLEKLISMGWINNFEDIYSLHEHEKEMQMLEGFGRKSVERLLLSIDNSRHTDFAHFINAVGIPGCGKSTSKDIATYCNGDVKKFFKIIDDNASEFLNINGVGESLITSINTWKESEDCYLAYEMATIYLYFENTISKPQHKSGNIDLTGHTYVITGSLNHFGNRDELKDVIENLGGRVGGSISSRTTALINNDINSTSSKNTKAKSAGVPILTEEQFLDLIGYKY